MCSVSDLAHTLDDIDLLLDLSVTDIADDYEYLELVDFCQSIVINACDLSSEDEIAYRNKVYAG